MRLRSTCRSGLIAAVIGALLALPTWFGGHLIFPGLFRIIAREREDVIKVVGLLLLAGASVGFLLGAGLRFLILHRKAEPDAAPNGGPATPSGNSGAAEGPPSVS